MAHIKKRGDSYLIRVGDGYDLEGKQISKHMTWHPPAGMSKAKADREAKRQAALFEEQVKTGMMVDGSIKFADFAQRWFRDYAEEQLRPKTVARYQDLMVRINPAIGHMSMKSIGPVQLMEFYHTLTEVHKNGKFCCRIDMKKYLKKKHMTKEKLAQKSGVSLATLSSVYKRKNIDPAMAQRISEALGKPVEYFFDPAYDDKPLAPKTILHYHRLISSIMSTAVKWQVILANPCDRVAAPKAKQEEAECLDAEQARHLLELLDGVPIQYRTAISMLLFTGMRRGELLGLEWKDVDFTKNIISIRRSSLYLPDRGTFEDETKNNSSRRVIRVPASAMELLKTYRHWQLEQQMSAVDIWQNTGKIFTAADGTPMHPDVLSGWFHDFIRTTDLPPIHLHSLRHTNATLAIANGIAVTTVAGQLGHASPTTTMKIYAHAIQSAQAAAADMMDELLKMPTSKPKRGRPRKAI